MRYPHITLFVITTEYLKHPLRFGMGVAVQKALQLFIVSHTTMPLYKFFKITKLCAVYLGWFGYVPNFIYR